jgi:hypothetical protein
MLLTEINLLPTSFHQKETATKKVKDVLRITKEAMFLPGFSIFKISKVSMALGIINLFMMLQTLTLH